MASPTYDVSEPVRVNGPHTLSVTLRTLSVVRGVSRLICSGDKSHSSEDDRIGDGFQRQIELQL